LRVETFVEDVHKEAARIKDACNSLQETTPNEDVRKLARYVKGLAASTQILARALQQHKTWE
jgi:hypothetical protein